MELANHRIDCRHAGGLTADMMLTRIDEVGTQDSHECDTQDSHEYVNFTRKMEPDAVEEKTEDEAVESRVGEELIVNDVVKTPDSEHHHREKLYTTEESDIDDHETEQAIEIFEEPSNFKTIKVQQLVYKIQEEEEKLNG
ncbi:hypothetical protein L5515_017893 [Caenorhabditis briggsae]|uniref:Uncharacterized protein n=1 Tax=Caenorhabditis briggsae TaxID=6238 RepID=A0AAE9JRJ6_CAEBR|nr:hypothetical protein L5515_017893 [Caenorhabditis briggsae]